MSQIPNHKETAAALRGYTTDVYQKVVDDGIAEINRLREELALWDAWAETLPETVLTHPTPKQGDCTRLNELYLKRTEQRNRVLTQLRERLDAVEKERDQLRLSNERMREALKEAEGWCKNAQRIMDCSYSPVSMISAALTAESGTEVQG